jgi:hypothetical protein
MFTTLNNDSLIYILRYLRLGDIAHLMQTCWEIHDLIKIAAYDFFRAYAKQRIPILEFLGKETYYDMICFMKNDRIRKGRDGYILTASGLLFMREWDATREIYKVLPFAGIDNAFRAGSNIYFTLFSQDKLSLNVFRTSLYGCDASSEPSDDDTPPTRFEQIHNRYYRPVSLDNIFRKQCLMQVCSRSCASIHPIYYLHMVVPAFTKYHCELIRNVVIFTGYLNGEIYTYRDGELQSRCPTTVSPNQLIFLGGEVQSWEDENKRDKKYEEHDWNRKSITNYDHYSPLVIKLTGTNDKGEECVVLPNFDEFKFADGNEYIEEVEKYDPEKIPNDWYILGSDSNFMSRALSDKLGYYHMKYEYRKLCLEKRHRIPHIPNNAILLF